MFILEKYIICTYSSKINRIFRQFFLKIVFFVKNRYRLLYKLSKLPYSAITLFSAEKRNGKKLLSLKSSF